MRKMLRKHNKILFLIIVAALLVSSVAGFFVSSYRRKRALEPVELENLLQDVHYFSAGSSIDPETLFGDTVETVRLVYGKAGMRLFESYKEDIYIEKEEKTVAIELPVFEKNGATVYLPEAVEYRIITSNYTVLGDLGEIRLSYGSAFNTENLMATKETAFLVDFGNEVYLNSVPFELRGGKTETVSANSLIQFKEDRVRILEFSDGMLQRKDILVDGQVMVVAEDIRISYYNFSKFLEDAKTSDTPVVSNQGIELSGDYFYYYMNKRYDIYGPCMLYETKEGLFIENDTGSHLLVGAPLYEAESNRIFLSRNYMMLKINQRQYYCLPAGTTVKLAEEAVYVTHDNTSGSYQEILLYDGSEHFVVLDEATFRMGEIELTISPMSCISVSDTMEICFYQYDSEEYFSFYTAGKKPQLEFTNGDVLNLFSKLITRNDGSLDLLQGNPAVFPMFQ